MPPNGQPRRNEQVTEIYSLPKLNQDEADNLNRWITRSETESVVEKKKPICKQKSRTRWLH